jgi:hypothetical protein
MQRYAALWSFPLLSLVLVVFMTVRGAAIVDAPEEPPVVTPSEVAVLQERSANLAASLVRSAEARTELERHVKALQSEVRELRAARTADIAEAALWRESYETLATRFDQLTALARREVSGARPVAAGFPREDLEIPVPAESIIVR